MPGGLPDPTRKDRHKLVNSFLTTASKFQGTRESVLKLCLYSFYILQLLFCCGSISGSGEAIDTNSAHSLLLLVLGVLRWTLKAIPDTMHLGARPKVLDEQLAVAWHGFRLWTGCLL